MLKQILFSLKSSFLKKIIGRSQDFIENISILTSQIVHDVPEV